MTWGAHQKVPFFGYTPVPLTPKQMRAEMDALRNGLPVPPRVPPQPRHTEKVDIDEAFAAAGDILEVFSRCLQWPTAQPFSGGVWDAWPARLTEGLAFCRGEWTAVGAFLKHEAEVSRG